MAFLAPLFFAALAALAVPVLIHLTQREKKQVIEFPSLMFLQRIPFQSARRRHIRDWPLLAMRLAAIALIVLAFTRPFVRQSATALASSLGPREVVVLLDRSYSMAYGDRWERAQAAARRAVQALGPNDSATLVLFGVGAELQVRATTDRGRILAAVDAAAPGAEATRYSPALKLAQRMLLDSRLPNREVVMISDFQQNGWIREESLRLPSGTAFTPVDVADDQTANVTVSSVMPQRSTFSGQERITVSAGLVNRSADAVTNIRVDLDVDGRTIETKTVTVPPMSPATVTFPPFTLARAFTRGTVKIAADRLQQDDAFHFVVSPAQRLPLLILERPGAPRESSLYLQRALAIGTAPAFQVETRQTDGVSSADLDRRRLVILNDTAALNAGAALKRFVSQGGGLLVLLGERAAWGADSNGLLPGMPGGVVDRAGLGGALADLDYSHPVLELFKAPRSGNLSTARFFRYRAITMKPPAPAVAPADPSDRVIARFDDGAVAMAERTIGAGRVMLWASTLDNYWNDLALKPVYLPFVHQVVRHLAAYEETPAWFSVGQIVDPARLLQSSGVGVQTGAGALILTPSGRRVEQSGTPAPLQLDETGFYEVRGSAAQQAAVIIASNPDTSESDLTTLDLQELTAALGGGAETQQVSDDPSSVLTPEVQERRQNFWWYLLMAGIALLGLETLMSNRMKGPIEGTTVHPTVG